MVAFIDNEMSIVRHEIRDFPFPYYALDQRNVDDPCRLTSSATSDSNLLRIDVQEGSQALYPLTEQLAAMNQHKRISGTSRDERDRKNGLPKRGCSRQDTMVVRDKCVEGLPLRRLQLSTEG
jgi:hypothetical protein